MRRRLGPKRFAVVAMPMLVLVSTVARAQQAPPAPSSERSEEAMALHDEAHALYERGEYREAIQKLEKALDLDPNGKELVYNLALIHEKLTEMDKAEVYYRRYLEMETDPKLRERVSGILKRIEGAKREVAARAADTGPTPAPSAEAQPAPALPADPPPPPRKTKRPWLPTSVVVSGGVAIGAAIVGSFFGVSALSHEADANRPTGAGWTSRDAAESADLANAHAAVADVHIAIAVAGAGAAVVFYLLSDRTAAPAPAGSLSSGALQTRATPRLFAVPF